MREKRLTTEPPDITEDAFEDYLATDDMLVNYFNEFLNLPTFAEPVKFNPDFGVFEVVNDTPQCLESQLKKILHNQKPPSPIYDVTRKAKNDGQLSKKSSIFPDFTVDPNYSIMRLEREQGIQWIKKERLPAFLKSDCYFEYRLAKLLSQVEWSRTGINFIIDTTYYPWIMKRELTPPFPEEDEEELIMRKFYVSLGKATVTQTKDWFTLAKKSQQTTTTDTITHPLVSTQIQGTQYWSTGPQRTIAYNHKVSPDSVPSQGTCSFSAQSYTADLYSSSSSNLGVDSLDMEYSQRSLPIPQRTGTAKTNNVRGRSKSTEVDTSVSIADTPSHTMLRVYLDQKWENGAEEKENLEYDGRQEMAAFQTLDEFTSAYIQYIVNESVSKLTGEPAAKSKTDMNFSKLSKVFIHELSNNQLSATAAEPLTSQNISPSNKLDSKGHCIKQETEEVSSSSRSESDVTDSRAAWCTSHRTYDIGNRNEFERFKKFIKGTLGERYWWLWMDIERLKVLKDTRRQQRQLDKMKKLYLVSSGDYFLNSEVLFKLDLLLGDQWNTRHLKWIQPEVVKPLLLYWGPRFCVTHTAAVQTASAKLKQWHTSHERPRTDIDPYPQMVTLLPLRAKSCIPRIAPSHPQRNETSSPTTLLKTNVTNLSSKRATRLLSATLPPSGTITKDDFYSVTSKPDVSRKRPKSVGSNMTRLLAVTDDTKCLKSQTDRKYTYAELLPGKSPTESVVLGSSKMECMLQSLYVENRAGYFFTRFCEKSGNELWKNSAYFWFDLQAYHQLFYQETLQPFKLCKQAQFLYATYIAPSASMDIGLQQDKKNEIYQKTEPPYEDLFDPAEEYILTLLLVPWMKMVEVDKSIYGKVELVEESRQLDSVYFRKLQALHQESVSKKDESIVPEVSPLPQPDVLREAQLLSEVPEEYRGWSLHDLIRNGLELEQFRLFLEEHSAVMDLMCWIDIEQFRRMLHKEKEKREEKSKDIKNKYLNKKYFFGPNSPATKEQQDQLMQSGGGWGHILHDRLSSAVLLEIQKYVQMRLEKKWLPLFLAKEQSGARRKTKPQIRDIAEDLLIQRNEKKIGSWKHVDNKWVSSSREIIMFRKALLNPVTALQFQRFVSLKGDLLENGVLFWQEVQKYKDLCHSHCDDATIQNKITAIINCFINSTIPPALQIDIPQEQAQKIIEHRRELGPYVFREAQMTIFALLFKFWPKFCEFRSNLADEKILPTLERKKEKKRQKFKRKTTEERLALVKQVKKVVSLSESISVDDTSMGRGTPSSVTGYGRQVSWSYSKYIEALEQERVLLKIQDDLEKRTSLFSTGFSSTTYLKPDVTANPEKSITSSNTSLIWEKQSNLPKDVGSESQIVNNLLLFGIHS
ncbi:regulator of G-protein signaling 22 isoform X6 [Mauremys reevesii]|uniref:regulator of G-protein signaling 22 isoform X6 n=1 Tax=Mauremys reevesii TaxID=260615 RepID=UPI00193F95AE|nr:regulator of G-protein signaling 22 isoform X6 [Mauremys reevesii]